MVGSHTLLSEGCGHLTSDLVNSNPTIKASELLANKHLFVSVQRQVVFQSESLHSNAQNADQLIPTPGKFWIVASVCVLIGSELMNEKQIRIRLSFTAWCLVIRVMLCITSTVVTEWTLCFIVIYFKFNFKYNCEC